MPSHVQVAVIGAGISGLSCAYRLRQRGLSVVVLESRPQAGGVIGTVERNGFLFESGPQSFLAIKSIMELIRALGIEDEVLEANFRAPRYVYKRGRLHSVPMSPPAILTTSLLSFSSRIRVISEPFRRTAPPKFDESVSDFVRRKFGQEILEYLVAPFVSGVYAGDPEFLSLKSAFPSLEEWERQHGSIIRGAINSRKAESGPRPGLCSFRGGMKTLMHALTRHLDHALISGVEVDSVERSGFGFTVRYKRGGQHEQLSVPAVVVAVPAYVASRLLQRMSPSLAKSLDSISYAPVGVVAFGYRRKQVGNSLIGFGVLIPRKEGFSTLGTVWNSSLFPGCAPAECVLMTSFVGGATDPEIVQQDDGHISSIVEQEVRDILEISGLPVERQIWRHAKGLPQYNLGHGHTLATIKNDLAGVPGLFTSGNYWIGPSIGNCVEASNLAADSAEAFISGGKAAAESEVPAAS